MANLQSIAAAALQSLRGASCLVTGGAGFIGSHLVEHLLQRGARVRVLDNLSTGFESNLKGVAANVQWQRGDAADPDAATRGCEGVDYVFHQAALASVPRSMVEPLASHQHCATAVVSILDAARKQGVKRVVYAASSSAYGNIPFSSKREGDLPSPLSPYAAAKLAGEFYCQAFYQGFGLETVALRYFNVFGPRQDPGSEYSAVIPRFVARILSGERPIIYGDGLQSRDFSYVENVVLGNLLAATVDGAAGGVFNIANGQSTTLLSLLKMLSEILGRPIEPIHEPARAGDVRDSLADIARAQTVLGYEPPVGVEEGLRRSVAYYQGVIQKHG
jgi:UDP-glucose 4-epimerase